VATGISARLSASEGRRFGLLVGAAWLALAALTGWRGHTLTATIFASVGVVLLVAGAIAPARLGPVYRGWMALAGMISSVTTPVFMGVVYFIVLTPLGWVRCHGWRSPLVHGQGTASCWIPREHPTPRPADMEHQF